MKTFKQILFTVWLVLYLQFRLTLCTNTTKESHEADSKDVCPSVSCENEASSLLENVNPEINPCDDFYNFACGNYVKANSPKMVDIDQFTSEVTEHIVKFVQHRAVKAAINKQFKKFNALEKTKIFFENCINHTRSDDENLEPFLEIFKKLGGWPLLLQQDWKEESYAWENSYKHIEYVGILRKLPFHLLPILDKKVEGNYNITVYPILNGIVDGELLKNRTIKDAYYHYMVDIATMIGCDKKKAREELEECLDFEMSLVELPSLFYNVTMKSGQKTIADLNQEYPFINWKNLFNNVLTLFNESSIGTENFTIIGANYLHECGKIIDKTPKRIVANYQFWQLLHNMIQYMPKQFYRRKLKFQEIAYPNHFLRRNRRSMCLWHTTRSFELIELALTVRKFGDEKLLQKVNNIIPIIRDQYRHNFNKRTDISNELKSTILNKLNLMQTVMGYSQELLIDEKIDEYYENLSVNSGSYLMSNINVTKFIFEKHFVNSRNSPEEMWAFEAMKKTVLDVYQEDNEKLVIPIKTLQKQLIHPNGPEYLSYGAIGFIIGHKIAHLIDTAFQRNLSDNKTQEWFRDFQECFIQQYNNYNIFDNITINGTLTLEENIADNEGFKIAYEAYNAWSKTNGIIESRLPGLNYTPEQLFWISGANIFCDSTDINFLKKMVKSHVFKHSPKIVRVNVAFSNLHEFARDFNCKIGTKMNPEKKCDLW